MKDLVLAFWGSLLPSILFNVNRKKLFWVGLSGTIGWFFYSNLRLYTGREILSISIGAFTVGLYSELMARMLKTPATVFSVSGVFPLVPGVAAYTTAQLIIEDKLLEATGKFIETVSSAGAIALGIMFATAIFSVLKKIKYFSSDIPPPP